MDDVVGYFRTAAQPQAGAVIVGQIDAMLSVYYERLGCVRLDIFVERVEDLMHLLHLPLPHQRGQPGILLVQSSVRCLTAELSDFSKEGGLGADGAGTGMGAAYGSTMRGRRSFHETGVVDLVAKAFDPEEKPPQGRARDGIVFVLNQTSIKT